MSLQKIGFSQNEAKTYLALIKLGSSKAGMISKHASMDRSSTYNSLKSLLQKGICSYVTIGKTKWFQCSDTSNVIKHLTNKVDLARGFLPTLEKLRKETKLKNNLTLFKGVKGIKTVFEDILNNAEEN